MIRPPFLVALSALLLFSASAHATKSECTPWFKDATEIDVRLVKPVDWVTGKLTPEIQALPNGDIHAKFAQRNKFNQLTSSNLAEIEARIRDVLQKGASANEESLLRYELATVTIQNQPTKAKAADALAEVDRALADPKLPKQVRIEATQVRSLALEILEEEAIHPPLKQVNWAISNQCPLCCKGCYFNFRNTQMDLNQAAVVASKLKREGVEEIILTGGDPLLSADFPAYVEMLHEMGFKVAVDTTGYTFTEELAMRLSGKLSFVGLPIDGHTQTIVETFRKGQNDTLNRVKATIALLQKYKIPVKINTTVTQKNVGYLSELAEMVEENGYAKNWGWSVFQWWDTRAEAAMLDEFAVDDARFLAAVEKIKRAFPKLNIRTGSVDSRSRQYFEIMTNGDVLNYSDGATPGSIILGNIIQDPVRQLVNSPALSKTSSKFRTWFHLQGGIPATQ